MHSKKVNELAFTLYINVYFYITVHVHDQSIFSEFILFNNSDENLKVGIFYKFLIVHVLVILYLDLTSNYEK